MKIRAKKTAKMGMTHSKKKPINSSIIQFLPVWITVPDEENGNDITSQVKLNEDGELLIEEIVKVFPGKKGKRDYLFCHQYQ